MVGGYRELIYLQSDFMIDIGYILYFFIKKKKGDLIFQLELGMGFVGIMYVGMWEFEVL